MFNNDEAGLESFKAWILDYKEKHGKEAVVPGMEPAGHYWFNLRKILQDNGMKPVLVNPHHVKKSKELDDNNPAKNDRKYPKYYVEGYHEATINLRRNVSAAHRI